MSAGSKRARQENRKPSLEIAPTTLATLLAGREFSTRCYLFTVSNSDLTLSHGFVTGFPNFTFTFQSVDYCFHPLVVNFDLGVQISPK